MIKVIKNNTVSVILAVIGLVADFIGIYCASQSFELAQSTDGKRTLLTVSVLIVIYSWAAIAWFFIARFVTDSKTKVEIIEVVFRYVASIGIMLFPFYVFVLLSIDTGYKAILGWIYFVSFPLILIGILMLSTNVFHKKVKTQGNIFVDNRIGDFIFYFSLFLVFSGIFSLSTSLGGFGQPDGKYICTYPFKGNTLMLLKGQSIVAVSTGEGVGEKMVITDSLGKHESLEVEVFRTHFKKVKE